MKNFTDRVVAITGAASGIGRALSIDLASRGDHLALAVLTAATKLTKWYLEFVYVGT